MKTQTPTKRTAHRLAAVLAIALAFATTGAWAANWTVSENTTLTADTTVDALTVEEGVTLDLNGYKLYCTFLAGSGSITNTSTDLTSPSGAVTWSTNGGTAQTPYGNGANLFNNTSPSNASDCSNNDKRIMVTPENLPLAVTYDFGEGNARKVDKYKIYFDRPNYESKSTNWHRGPKTWTFEGSNDGETWETLDTENNVSWLTKNCSPQEFSFTNNTAYRFYRITFTASDSNLYLELHQLEYFNTNPGELHVNIPEGGAATVGSLVISGNVKVVSEGTGSFTIDADVDVKELVFNDGASATLTVAKGKTLTTENINGIGKIINNGTIVKTGTGTVDWPFDNASTGLYVVSAGTVRVNKHTGTGNAGSSQIIRVKKGATFDIRGTKAFNFSVVLEEGSRFVNSSSDILNNNSQAMSLSLEGDATVTHYRTFGLRGPVHGETTLNLGTYTLTLDSNGGNRDFLLDNTTISGTGTLFVKNGTLYVTMNDSVGEDCTVSIGSGAELNLGQNLSVGNFVNNGTISGSGMLTVLGELTPGNTITNLTLASGATVKATGTAQVVSTTFAASGTIIIDASEITKAQLDAGDVPVLTVPAAFNPSGITWNVSGAPVADARTKWRTDEGGSTKTLYVGRPTGLTVVFW